MRHCPIPFVWFHVSRRDDRPFLLMTHGTLVQRYGIETLIEAVAIVKPQIPNIRLEIVGFGEYEPYLMALAQKCGLQSEVTFVGFLPSYEQVAPRLIRADIGVVPIWTDFQLCNKLVDYLALGIAAVTTESLALQPYLKQGEVMYVPPRNPEALAEAILKLYLQPDLRASLAEAGHLAYLKHFAWLRVKHDYLAMYTENAGAAEDAPLVRELLGTVSEGVHGGVGE